MSSELVGNGQLLLFPGVHTLHSLSSFVAACLYHGITVSQGVLGLENRPILDARCAAAALLTIAYATMFLFRFPPFRESLCIPMAKHELRRTVARYRLLHAFSWWLLSISLVQLASARNGPVMVSLPNYKHLICDTRSGSSKSTWVTSATPAGLNPPVGERSS